MNNFLEFIKKDIEAKRTLVSTLPTKTKTAAKKKNQTIASIEGKYLQYKSGLVNYLLAKSRSFELKEVDNSEEVSKLNEKIVSLEHVKFLLNPSNTYLEKMGFDVLLYQINHYSTFNFNSLNDIINGFLDKFELANILLTADDFHYTCYVHEYMSTFLEARRKKTRSYDKVSEIFEQIYWINPEIIEHIELNFRKLIKLNEKKFTSYIYQLQKEVMEQNKVANYNACLEKLQSLYVELNLAKKETVPFILSLARNGEIDVEQLQVDNKARINAYQTLVPQGVNQEDPLEMEKVCTTLEKLKLNIEEYDQYIQFLPLFKHFKEEYEKLVPGEGKESEYKGLKEIEAKIEAKENELDKINKKIFSGKPGLFEFKTENDLKHLKAESVLKAKELYELYKTYDQEYFKDKVLAILNNTLTIADLLHLYYSFDYFKKLAIQEVYQVSDYSEISKYSESFDLFAMNPTNLIVNGLPVFEETDIPKIIVNKYSLNNIRLDESTLEPSNLQSLLNKILLVLRVEKIKRSTTSVEKIWFMVQVDKIMAQDQEAKK